MKALLALSLLLFLDSVFSQEYVACNLLEKCPEGYTPQYSGRTHQVAACICKKDPPEESICSFALSTCRPNADKDCSFIGSICPPKEIIDFCNKGTYSFPAVCDRANERLRKEKYAKTQQDCETYKNLCNTGISRHCISAADNCEPDTTIQLCKNNRMPATEICTAAEIRKEEERVEDKKYTCNFLKKNCVESDPTGYCSEIIEYCDIETAAKWCFKDETRKRLKISDKDCTNVIKKSQYLMFGESKRECWKQVPLCEGGNSEACTQVATFCAKEVVSALCHANKIENKRVCTYAGFDGTTSSSYPGCKYFADKCKNWQLCDLAFRYCDKDTVAALCDAHRIPSRICRGDLSVPVADFLTVSNGIPVIITSVLGLGF